MIWPLFPIFMKLCCCTNIVRIQTNQNPFHNSEHVPSVSTQTTYTGFNHLILAPTSATSTDMYKSILNNQYLITAIPTY